MLSIRQLAKMLAQDAKRQAEVKAKRELARKTFTTTPGRIAQEHDEEVMTIETDAMKRAAMKRRPTQ